MKPPAFHPSWRTHAARLLRRGGLALAVASLLAGCSSSDPAPAAPGASPATAYVAVARGKVDIEGGLLSLAMPREGTLATVAVHEGDQVRQGQLLAALDTEPATLAVQAAQAQLEQAQAQLKLLGIKQAAAKQRAQRLAAAGAPGADATLVGPLIDTAAGDAMANALAACRAQGNIVTGGERLLADRYPHACYVRPALVMTDEQHDTMLTETFAPILYMMPYTTLDEAIALNNAAAHGLSSCIFTESMREAERFLSSAGSDCGIANVNIGTSGAEIGGAFGGEKATGGGRESGSDAWKGYMRRATNTINYGDSLPLAQGIRFEI
jgi:acyl-CoA reductase-like NAD-dependent aldehyde dehydrogenase